MDPVKAVIEHKPIPKDLTYLIKAQDRPAGP